MEITVHKILPHDDMEIDVTINFFDETKSPHNSARVTVFIERKDYSLSELKEESSADGKGILSLRNKRIGRTCLNILDNFSGLMASYKCLVVQP